MKKLFTLLAALMFTFTTSVAQHNFYFWGKNGNVSIEVASHVDSLAFSAGNWLFQISKPANLGATTSAFRGTTKVALNDKVKSIDVTPEVGVCYSNKNTAPTYNDFKKDLGSDMRDYSFTIMNVTSGTTYYYRTYVKLLDEVYYGDVNTVTTLNEEPQDIIINGHKFVDLGLPSGLLWAETNVGASSATDDGNYFAWGETETKTTYSSSTYKWGNYNITKYNSSDKKTTLDPEDDVATVNWGAPCRMPDSSDFKELYDHCDWSWKENGYIVTGPNGQSIFLPASGYGYDDGIYRRGLYGRYWSRSLDQNSTLDAYDLNLDKDGVIPTYDNNRYYGYTIRPVAKK